MDRACFWRIGVLQAGADAHQAGAGMLWDKACELAERPGRANNLAALELWRAFFGECQRPFLGVLAAEDFHAVVKLMS